MGQMKVNTKRELLESNEGQFQRCVRINFKYKTINLFVAGRCQIMVKVKGEKGG